MTEAIFTLADKKSLGRSFQNPSSKLIGPGKEIQVFVIPERKNNAQF